MLAERDAKKTRAKLLAAAYAEIHRQGFQAASLANILADSGLTKGALYHHFPNKQALGLAVVDEVISREIYQHWLQPLENGNNPIDALVQVIEAETERITPEDIKLGCPLNNLAQEMSPIDEKFRLRIDALYQLWRSGIAAALTKGQQNGSINTRIDSNHAAAFIVAALEGCIGTAKTAQSETLLHQCGAGLIHYLESLRS